MGDYVVSARKYRPASFETVVGQGALTETLRNAISQQHLAHAYLFCGPRGVGKTTCARIFAKTINCLNPTSSHEACDACDSCVAFNEQRSFNIHELDAASNNSVDDMRALIEQVRIPPQLGKYSVYIIDEVHMLSQQAFNALLKTLEEPPSYAIFILATTEKNKILPTILSRCQVYDFARITVKDIILHLLDISKKEGVEVSEEALNVVAQKADGGMRDALSIYDQLVAFCGNKITYERTIEVLNVLDTDYYFRVVNLALNRDIHGLLLLFDEVLRKGFDGGNFVTGLASHVRDVLVSLDASTVELLQTSQSIREHYVEQAKKCTAQWLFSALDILNTCDLQYRTSKNKRLSVELCLIKMANILGKEAPVSVAASPSVETPQKPVNTANTAPKVVPPAIPKIPSIPKIDKPAPPEKGTPNGDQSFTPDQFSVAWAGLQEAFDGEQRVKVILSVVQVEQEGKNITVSVQNKMQADALKKQQEKILENLHKSLNISDLRLFFKINTDTPLSTSSNATYDILMKKNGALERLRTGLNLKIQ